MPLNKIIISRTFHLGESNFFKIGQGGTIADGETREELTEDAIKFIYSTLRKYCPETDIVNPLEKQKQLPVINTSGDYANEDKEWEKVKSALNSFACKEDAQAYLDLTPYRLTLEAKKIVNQKISKNER